MHSKLCLQVRMAIFLTYFAKNPMKIECFYDFLRKNQFLPIFAYKMAISQFSWARSHYVVIVMSYINGWYLFWYQWKEDVHTYTLVVNLGLYDLQYW